MKEVLLVVQIAISVGIITLVMMQSKGTGLGRSFGSTNYHSRRGLETMLFRLTIGLVVLFVSISIISQLFI